MTGMPSGRNRCIIELYEAGFGSTREIAIEVSRRLDMVVTKNMVISTLSRYRDREGYNARKRELYRARRSNAPPPPLPLPPEYGRLSILDLTARTCRWPIGERPNITYCGAECPVETPYCAHHAALAHHDDREGSKYVMRRQVLGGGYR